MAPLLVTALVGVGVKVATDLLMSGFKSLTRSNASTAAGAAPTASFASTLDTAKSGAPASPMTASSGAVALDAGLGDRSRVRAAELASGPLPASRAHGIASYHRFDEVQAP